MFLGRCGYGIGFLTLAKFPLGVNLGHGYLGGVWGSQGKSEEAEVVRPKKFHVSKVAGSIPGFENLVSERAIQTNL